MASNKHPGHIRTTSAWLAEYNPNGWTGRETRIVITVEHCACTSFSRSVAPTAIKRFKKIPGATGNWIYADADFAFSSNGNYCLSNITFEKVS